MPTGEVTNGVAYLRESVDRRRSGLAMQLRAILRRAREMGITLDAAVLDVAHMGKYGVSVHKSIVADDGQASTDMPRLGLRALLEIARTDPSVKCIIAYTRDRISRRREYMERFERELRCAGVRLICVDSS